PSPPGILPLTWAGHPRRNGCRRGTGRRVTCLRARQTSRSTLTDEHHFDFLVWDHRGRRLGGLVAPGLLRCHDGGVAIEFAPSQRSTLGVEWELALVDADSGDLRQVAQTILDALAPDGSPHPAIRQELLLNTVEVVSKVCATTAEAIDDLSESVELLRTLTDPLRVDLMSAGTHPFAHWGSQKVSNKSRYATLIDRTQFWGRQMLIYGVHVHVGIEDRDKVFPILGGLLAYYPHLLALSASSPFWDGRDTGYASNRALLFQQLPTAGLPYTTVDS